MQSFERFFSADSRRVSRQAILETNMISLRISLGLVAAIQLGAAFVISCVHAQATGEYEYSFSLEETRKKGTFITKVKMDPSSIKWQRWEITVGDAWLEKSKNSEFYLCFCIDKGKEAFLATNHTWFVMGDSQSSVGMHVGIGLKWILVRQRLESPDLSKARFSVVGSLKENRMNNIQFIPTK
jgi:hypothetical protein